MMTITEERLNRVAADWKFYAKEPIRMDTNGSTVIYGFGSELATLRILDKYRFSKNVGHFWNDALQSWCVSLRINGL